MSETLLTRADIPADQALPSGPLAWQRTATIGTELVFPHAGERPGAHGTAVVTGVSPHAIDWQAEIAPDAAVRDLTVICSGADWSRTARLRHSGDGWECEAPGGPATIDPDAVVRLADSPIFVTWALRRLGLTVKTGPVRAPSVRILTPSLTVVPGTATYHLVSPHRLRITGDGPAVTYELDHAGLVVYQPGNLRLAR
ncbi:putative glycolipid-binding domain-containing protein [Actinoplanes philippinensis]|uniref:putative glycolipid-binding domain-containing protein n=1 Tax=Actinoplanes philippinensis TaxID=35752 RepID=UPI0033F662AE